MDSVTEGRAAIAMARDGGIGILHKNLTPDGSGARGRAGKRAESGMIVRRQSRLGPTQSLREALEVMREHDISGVPVVEGDRPVGILTARDIRFEKNLDQPVQRAHDAASSSPCPRASQRRAKELLHQHRIEKLLVVDGTASSSGSSPSKTCSRPTVTRRPSRTSSGRLRVGAAIGPGPDCGTSARPRSLPPASTSSSSTLRTATHKGVIDAVRATKKEYPARRGHRRQRRHRRGHRGPHRRRRRRGQSRASAPAASARRAWSRAWACRRSPPCATARAPPSATASPIIADGGVKYSGDVIKAIAAGASA